MKIVDVYESTYFGDDNEFEHIEYKEEYYLSEFWDGSDYLVDGEKVIRFIIDWDSGEIIVNDDIECYDEILLLFASKRHSEFFDELMVGNDFRVEDDEKYDSSKIYIKYRGGSGYAYYHHQYKG